MYCGAYWGKRMESTSECVSRMHQFLTDLHTIDALFQSWFMRGRSRRDALRLPVSLRQEDLTLLFQGGRHNEIADLSKQELLGYTVGLWNGQSNSVGLSVSCGAATNALVVPNALVLDLPPRTESTMHIYDRDIMNRVMIAIANAWNPDWAVCTTTELRDIQWDSRGVLSFGWLTFIARHNMSGTPSFPHGIVTQALAEGILIQARDNLDDMTAYVIEEIRIGLIPAGVT